MASSQVLLALVSFRVSIGNSNEFALCLQRLLANSIEIRGAGQPKESNPRRSPKSLEAVPNSQTRAAPPQILVARLGSNRLVPHEVRGDHPGGESWVVV